MGNSDDTASRLQACKRCHTRKRKCDRAHPRCSSCASADVPCEVDPRPADQALVSAIDRLQNRVTWLEDIIRNALPEGENISDIPTNSSLPPDPSSNSKRSTHTFILPGANSLSSPATSVSTLITSVTSNHITRSPDLFPNLPFLHPTLRFNRIDWQDFDIIPPEIPTLPTVSAEAPLSLPPYQTTVNLLRRFTQDYKFTHQVASLPQLERDARVVYVDGETHPPEHAASRFRVLCVLYLAGEGILGYIKYDKATWRDYRERAMAELPNLCNKEDLTCVQIMTLLGVVAVYVTDLNLSQIISVGARTAHAIGLHRNDADFLGSYLNTQGPTSLERVNDQRKRILWSLYILDRLAQSILGVPPCLRDDDIACDLPSPPKPNVGAASMATAQMRHAIAGRKLMGQIQEALYGSTVTANTLGEAIVSGYVNQIQIWYSSSPFKAAFFPLSDTSIKRQFLDDLSYQQMIIALHRPSRLLPHVSSSYIIILVESAKMSLDLFSHYVADNKVILHWCYLYQVFTICVALVYGYHEQRFRFDLETAPEEEASQRLDQCRAILRKFSSCPQTPALTGMFEGLVAALGSMDSSATQSSFPDFSFNLQSLSANETMGLLDATNLISTPNNEGDDGTNSSRLLAEWWNTEVRQF